MLLKKIVSGGQTGADRAALDAAIEFGLDHGGWAPRGRWAEDGLIPARYKLSETPSSDTRQRTEWNVRDSDATLIVASSPLEGGTKLTAELGLAHGKPLFWADPATESVVEQIQLWLSGVDGSTLNVAGPRASKDPTIYDATYAIIEALTARS